MASSISQLLSLPDFLDHCCVSQIFIDVLCADVGICGNWLNFYQINVRCLTSSQDYVWDWCEGLVPGYVILYCKHQNLRIFKEIWKRQYSSVLFLWAQVTPSSQLYHSQNKQPFVAGWHLGNMCYILLEDMRFSMITWLGPSHLSIQSLFHQRTVKVYWLD